MINNPLPRVEKSLIPPCIPCFLCCFSISQNRIASENFQHFRKEHIIAAPELSKNEIAQSFAILLLLESAVDYAIDIR